MKPRLFAAAAALLLALSSAAPARAARPLLDQHQWDRYFALFARNEYLPWQPVQVRLDTYSGAPVDMAVYDVDPADALIAKGATVKERPIDLSHAHLVANWRFTPPAGYRYTSNLVTVPLGGREGFFVVEARRGDASQQVWVDVASAGMIAKSGPDGLFIYAADLRTGRPLSHMRLTFVANGRFDVHYTDLNGVYRWTAKTRPIFLLGEWGKSIPFLSLLPQAPDPRSALVVRVDRDTVRSGDTVRVAGFARVRKGEEMVPARGEVAVRVVGDGRTEAATHAELDENGAFSAQMPLPRGLAAGEYAVLATAAGTSGSAPLTVVPQSDGIAISIDAPDAPAPASAVPVALLVQRDGHELADAEVKVRVLRVPHALPPGFHRDLPGLWGTSTVYAQTLRTDADGRVSFTLQPPTDGLPSTYVVRAYAGNASAESEVVASAPDALEIRPERMRVAEGSAIRLLIRGFRVGDGWPTAGVAVRVTLSHGVSTQQQTVRLDRTGEATVTFDKPFLGGNLIVAKSGETMDAVGVVSAPQDLALSAAATSSAEIALKAEREGEALRVDADLPGAAGAALLTLQTGGVVSAMVTAVRAGRASAKLSLRGVSDNATVGAAFVKDGALVWRDVASPIAGRLRVRVETPKAVMPGALAELHISVGSTAPATAVVRVADAVGSPGSSFSDAVALAPSAAVTTQNTAPEDSVWHAWVTPAGSNVGDLFALQRTQVAARTEPVQPTPTRVYAWDLVRGGRGSLTAVVAAPKVRGRYALSVLVISADGRVGTAAASLEVQ